MTSQVEATSIAEIEASVAGAVAAGGLAADPSARLLDLTSEIGELAKEFLDATAYGAGPFERTPSWDEELGDVAFALFALAATTGTPLAEVVAASRAKVESRLARTGSASSGRARRPAGVSRQTARFRLG